VTVGDDGIVQTIVRVKGADLATLREGDGSALVLHAMPDDYKTDPSGDSGDRVACAVI
jgi:superoxide dismutase, Cu-Zn family